MREVIFRGKPIGGEDFVEGSLVANTIENEGRIEKQYHIQDITYGTFPNDYMSGLDELVQSDSIGEFVGLFDKNGKKIFEGDVVSVCRGVDVENGVVCYDSRCASFIINYYDGTVNLFADMFMASIKDDRVKVEVIGNIYGEEFETNY